MSTQAQARLEDYHVEAHRFAVTVTRNGAGCTQVTVVGEIDANSLDLLDRAFVVYAWRARKPDRKDIPARATLAKPPVEDDDRFSTGGPRRTRWLCAFR
ncbi:hypothetical protein [Amycolatopsis anabasis]|uniref:hypothetical protein n=1 Tax=Amycolatopsis anabasis TaxID=1840409 RepID=UPI00131C3484|nr:hypothetical protein [Amycolatopsis anabasis]